MNGNCTEMIAISLVTMREESGNRSSRGDRIPGSRKSLYDNYMPRFNVNGGNSGLGVGH